MLVLNRRAGESIQIGRDIVITVCHIRGQQVKIGIEAPKSVDVTRKTGNTSKDG